MKRIALLLTLTIAIAATAQQDQAPAAAASPAPQVRSTNVVEREQVPTYSDIYCAGFVTNQGLQRVGYVAGGWATPDQTRYVDREYVYLEGRGFTVGERYLIVREVHDPNRYESFTGQFAIAHHMGRAYADVGRVRVIALHNNIAITQVEFNCGDVLLGDAAIPFSERPQPMVRTSINFDRFAPSNGKLSGKIVITKDFDTMAGMGRKVYLNVGANQGVKVGDYFRAVRTYESLKTEEINKLSFMASAYDDVQVPAGVFSMARVKEFPRISLGEMLVLNVSPTSSTAMITMSLEDLRVGDGVELEEPPPAPAAKAEPEPEAAPAPTAAVPQPPTIACSAQPATVRAGETATISCESSSPDGRPISFTFSSPSGRLVAHDNTAVLDTHDVAPGAVEVLAKATDDRDLSATSRTTVDVEEARPALAPAKLNVVSFKHNSAYVNNEAKAVLDDVAMRLQRDSDSSLVVLGLVENGETKDLAQKRASNAADYLSKSKGIDTKRLQQQDGGEYGNKAELWLLPPGTRLENANLQH